MRMFCDASALAKRYVEEAGSAELETLLGSATTLGPSVIFVTEVVSALCRLLREGNVSEHQYAQARTALLADMADAEIVTLSEPLLVRAIGLLEAHSLRSADALQVASAQEWGADLFVSADRRQCAAAHSDGLPVRLLG